MRCHTCPHHEAVQRGDFSSKPWNTIPCSTCLPGDEVFFSVPLDEENPPVPAPGYSLSPADDDPAIKRRYSSVPLADVMPVEVLAKFIEGLLSLSAELRDIIAWRFLGISYKEIAKRQGTSIQLAEMRHKRALRECPLLRTLFPEKIAKRRRRLSRK